MKVILFGATGMIGQGVLRECLLDNDVDSFIFIYFKTPVRYDKLYFGSIGGKKCSYQP